VITYQLLPPIKFPLVNKYYQAHRAGGRAASNNVVMVARHNNEIVGVARLAPIDQLWFLTGVHVDEGQRCLGIASQLINQLAEQQSCIYSFPFEHLVAFYERLGFQLVTPDSLPCELAQRFNAYVKQGRKILAMIKQ
jgi:N-acetylglutamate synthase-like GNAT family acetyltransferase